MDDVSRSERPDNKHSIYIEWSDEGNQGMTNSIADSMANISRDLVTVLLVGHPDKDFGEKIKFDPCPKHWADGFNVTSVSSDSNINTVLAAVRPQVIVSFGDIDTYVGLLAAPLDIRRRWIHKDDPGTPPNVLANDILTCFVDASSRNRFPKHPLVSVFTPTYNSVAFIDRLYRSIVNQTYTNWEWVVYDDSTTSAVFDKISAMRAVDPRIQLFKSGEPCGVIGEVKRRCCGLARGEVFVEVDHDDELIDTCLADIVEAFARFPDAGFAYTDNAVVFDNGNNGTYGENYAFGFGSYRRETYRGREYMVTNYPSINSKTVRHIVGMPDHVRAWRRDAYHRAGGHGSLIHVADDYELCIRTFLTTRMVHVQRFGYIQYHHTSGSNAHRVRNKEIQRLVAKFAERYEPEIHQRFLDLGVDDFIHRNGRCDWSISNPDTVPIANYVLGPRGHA